MRQLRLMYVKALVSHTHVVAFPEKSRLKFERT